MTLFHMEHSILVNIGKNQTRPRIVLKAVSIIHVMQRQTIKVNLMFNFPLHMLKINTAGILWQTINNTINNIFVVLLCSHKMSMLHLSPP